MTYISYSWYTLYFSKLGHTVYDWSVLCHVGIMNKENIIKLKDVYTIDGCNIITREIGDMFYETLEPKYLH